MTSSLHRSEPCTTSLDRRAGLALFFLSLWLLFHALGNAALFEPDEGRNAEVAREILVLDDWVTPHYNFVPRLDKPPFFYWLVALSYKIFGISEWSARLPSAVAAFGLVLLTCAFAWSKAGPAGAWWSGLILLTSAATVALAGTVIPDMVLSFFITLSLCSFFWGSRTEEKPAQRSLYLTMYGAMGVAVLIKGLIGLVLPGLIIVTYLMVKQKWRLLRKMDLIAGLALFLAVAAPWYLLAELRNPGYIRYFLWEEHLLRYWTPRFGRSEPWYYFFLVGAVGFLPWSPILPWALNDWRKKNWNDRAGYLLIWILLPILFFSFSDSKLPHYIFPIFPPLSILAGIFLARISAPQRKNWLFFLPWLIFLLPLLFLGAGFFVPDLLPPILQRSLARVFQTVSPTSMVSGVFVVSLLVFVSWTFFRARGRILYLVFCAGFAVLSFTTVEPLRTQVSQTRSSKELAAKSSVFLQADDWVGIYNAHLMSLPFYLRRDEPLGIVQAEGKDKVMGSFYAARHIPAEAGSDRIVFNHGEFSALWKTARRRLMVFVHEKELHQMLRDTGGGAEILKAGDVRLFSNRRPGHPKEVQ